MDLPRADENGFFLEEFEENFVRFGTTYAWERELGISHHTIKRRLGGYEGQSGYSSDGQFLEKAFFSEPLVRKVCADLIKDVPEADANGFFMDKKGGEQIGTIGAWADLFGVDRETIRSRLKGRTGTAGKIVNGNILPNGFYPETLIRKLCGDIIQKVSKADDEGFIYSGSERSMIRYATRRRWAAVLGLNQKTVEKRLRGYQGITGKTSIGHLSVDGFFTESLVRERCADLLK